MRPVSKYFYLGAVGCCLLPSMPPALALFLGIVYGLSRENPWPETTATISQRLLQLAVVGMGFGVPLNDVWQVGRQSFFTTLIGILITLSVGWVLGRLFGVAPTTSLLVSCGTAICGGSAIAAIAPVIRAKNDESAVALATVFSLNALALLLFPLLGHWLNMEQHQFGTWAGMAIHDTSSVVGAAASYGQQALHTATTVKLTRAMWIAPLALCIGLTVRSHQRVRIPLFIVAFIAAAALSSALPSWRPLWQPLTTVARQALTVSLFFIGSGLQRSLLRQVGLNTLIQGVLLWLTISSLTLFALRSGLI